MPSSNSLERLVREKTGLQECKSQGPAFFCELKNFFDFEKS